MRPCPCQSGNPFETCCGPYLAGTESPPTAEALMRARYTAYVEGDIDFIERTQHPDTRATFDKDAARKWSRESDWEGLEILETVGGAAQDDEGEVEFLARFSVDGVAQAHRERATFSRLKGTWYFVDGTPSKGRPVRRSAPKVGPNAPCPCGSGKKFKKCCGRP